MGTGSGVTDEFGWQDTEFYRLLSLDKYGSRDLLTQEEVEEMCRRANEGLATMNGDTAGITITVRQFLILMEGAFRGGEVWERH